MNIEKFKDHYVIVDNGEIISHGDTYSECLHDLDEMKGEKEHD